MPTIDASPKPRRWMAREAILEGARLPRIWSPLWGLAILILASPALGAPGVGAKAPVPTPSRTPAPAQRGGDPPASAEVQRQARVLFQKGLVAFAAQRYPDALAHFTASSRLVEKNVVLYNIAMCHRALFEYTKAIAAFEDYLKRRGARLPLMKRREVERFIKEMQSKLGHLRLTVDPDGAEVRLDGRLMGRTPLGEPLAVDPGRRVVVISHPERLTKTLQITVVGGEVLSQAVRLTQAPQDGRLVLRCSAPQCRVHVAGEAPQALPVTLSLPPGIHRLRVEAPGHLPQALTVQVAPQETVTREVLLVTAMGGDGHGDGRPLPLVRRWWFWVALSAGLAAVAATTTGLVLWDQSRPRSQADLTWRLP